MRSPAPLTWTCPSSASIRPDVLEFLQRLRKITTSERGCTRIAYTEAEQQAHDLAWETVVDLGGLVRREDAAGNLFIVPEAALAADHEVLLAGSHLDTVVEGGWLDGGLGVAAGLTALRGLTKDGQAHERFGVVVFRDEEGVRFNTGLFGSLVFAGLCTEEALAVRDRDGVAVADVVPDPAGCVDYHPPVKPLAFLECHIEQGNRLVEAEQRIGVVDGIVGISRFALTAVGLANHAGTTEMSRRRDALIPVARVVADLPPLVQGLKYTVITCGRLHVAPDAANIVPGRVDAVIEIRGQDRPTIDRVTENLRSMIDDVAARHHGVVLTLDPIVSVAPTPTDPSLRRRLAAVLTEMDIDGGIMPSMAGHDTQHAMYQCPAGMFFIPSIGGISHNPDEDSTEDDVVLAGDVMTGWVTRVLAHHNLL